MRSPIAFRWLVCAAVALLPAPAAKFSLSQQTAPSTPSTRLARALGTVKAVTGSSLTLTTDAGSEVNAQVQPSAVLVKTAPGRKDLQGATPVSMPEIQPGDRVLVRGKLADDGKSIFVTSAVVMKREDIAQKQEQEREDWNRGIAGVVKSVDLPNGVITISAGSMGAKTVVVHVSKATILRRYALDSVKFDDAKPAALQQTQAGDQLRARGSRSVDGSEFTADEIVSGTFRNIGGTVLATNAADRSITVTDLLSKKQVTVRVEDDSQLRKLPPMMAAAIAARLKGTPPGAQPQGGSGEHPVTASTGGSGDGSRSGYGSGAAGGSTGGRSGDFQQILSRMPAVSISDLQKGDAVIIVATEGSSTAEPTAITLLTGVEAILSASPRDNRAAMALSPWSLGMPEGDSGP